jgi:MFS family permease
VLRSREFWLLGLTGVMPVYVQFLLATWGPAFFVEIGVRDLARSALLASLQGLSAPLGLLVSGLVADRLHERGVHRKVNVAVAMILTALSLAAMGFTIERHGPAWLVTLFILTTSFFVWCGWGPAYAIFGPMFPPSVLGKAFGAYNTICFTGAVAAPVVTGWLRDLTGSFVAGIYGAAVLSLLSVVSVMALRPAFRLAGAPPPVAAPTRP